MRTVRLCVAMSSCVLMAAPAAATPTAPSTARLMVARVVRGVARVERIHRAAKKQNEPFVPRCTSAQLERIRRQLRVARRAARQRSHAGRVRLTRAYLAAAIAERAARHCRQQVAPLPPRPGQTVTRVVVREPVIHWTP
jgi:hypothetical protein